MPLGQFGYRFPAGECDVETCGKCCLESIANAVADERREGVFAVDAETMRCWRETKFVRLWTEERAAGRDPNAAFAEKGWMP